MAAGNSRRYSLTIARSASGSRSLSQYAVRAKSSSRQKPEGGYGMIEHLPQHRVAPLGDPLDDLPDLAVLHRAGRQGDSQQQRHPKKKMIRAARWNREAVQSP